MVNIQDLQIDSLCDICNQWKDITFPDWTSGGTTLDKWIVSLDVPASGQSWGVIAAGGFAWRSSGNTLSSISKL